MESLARSVLRRYFDGVDNRSLDLGLLRGDVVLRDLRLNTAALLDSPAGQALEALPFTIRGMAVGEVRVRWAWRRLLFGRLFGLLDSTPGVELTVDRVYLEVALRDEAGSYDAAAEAAAAAEERKDALAALEDAGRPTSLGAVERALLGVLQKVYAAVTNVHVRLHAAAGSEVPTVGLTLGALRLSDAAEPSGACPDGAVEPADGGGALLHKHVAVEAVAAYCGGAAEAERGAHSL